MPRAHDKSELPGFMQTQYAFAAHIRDPQHAPQPAGVESRRMAIYNELFYNNVEDFMSSSFPVLRSLYEEEAWHALIRTYFSRHRSTTPLFPEMPREFLKFLEDEYEAQAADHPFMLELAHYEWLELALALADEQNNSDDIDPTGDLLAGKPVLSSLAWPQHYHYPVHKICTAYTPSAEERVDTHLLVYRDQQDEIHFMELNPVTALLIQLIKQGLHASGRECLEDIARQLNHPNPQTVVNAGLAILNDLHQRRVVLGVSNE